MKRSAEVVLENPVVRRPRRNLPTFQSTVQFFGESPMPHIVALRPLTTGGENANFDQVLRTIAGTVRDAVQRSVMRFTGWSRARSVREVQGRLIATNEVDGATHGFTSDFIGLNQITHQAILDIFERIQQSNTTVTITDITWEFHIDPNSIAVGGAVKVKPPSWVTVQNYRKTWEGHEGINCAAFALCYLMYGTERDYSHCPQKATRDALALQEELGWEENVSLKELQKFVDVYPTFRLTAFLPHNATTPFTFTGKQFVLGEYQRGSVCPDKVLYLVYDATQKHFGATKSPGKILTRLKKSVWQWCHRCIVGFKDGHECEYRTSKKQKVKAVPCEKCGVIGAHTCALVTCKFCSSIYKKEEGWDHRCILFKEPRKEKNNVFYTGVGAADGSLTSLWVYDFESCIKIEESAQQVITDFRTDEQGMYLANEDVCVYDFTIQKHEVNFVACRNVFVDDEPKEFFGENALQDFILFTMSYNGGNNIFLAHNGSGYDTRLLFTGCKLLEQPVAMCPIMRGGKFMQLTLGKHTIFRDSLLHVRGSLKALAKDFCDGTMAKGYFPHLFNSVENYDYVGPLPDKKYFDLSFMVRSEKDLQEFNDWYDSFEGEWNFMVELKKYCHNDVDVLKKIVKGYHDIAFATFQMSPWFNATAPSFVHEVFVVKLGQQLELPDRAENREEYKERIMALAWDEYWAVLKPAEYWFARKALRGGRTEIRKVHHLVSEEEWNRGIRIRYQDICSQYPYQQVEEDFPVGLPTIYTWDDRYVPCVEHQNDPQAKCDCRRRLEDKFCRVSKQIDQWTVEDILRKDDQKKFFGIVCATVIPPKDMYHPILVAFDEGLNKSVASCEQIDEGVFTSVEFVTALRHGYTLVKLHRYDEYNRKPSLWRDIILDLFLEKMVNSKKEPGLEEKEKLIEDYEELFGEDFGDKIRKTFVEKRWGKNPAKKQTAKIMMNSAWGKHAQRPIMTEAKIFDFEEDERAILDFFENCVAKKYEYQDGTYLNEKQIMYKYMVSGPDTKPDLHKGYLPAALFVPAYGRLHLWYESKLCF
jgi:hypothetical protein